MWTRRQPQDHNQRKSGKQYRGWFYLCLSSLNGTLLYQHRAEWSNCTGATSSFTEIICHAHMLLVSKNMPYYSWHISICNLRLQSSSSSCVMRLYWLDSGSPWCTACYNQQSCTLLWLIQKCRALTLLPGCVFYDKHINKISKTKKFDFFIFLFGLNKRGKCVQRMFSASALRPIRCDAFLPVYSWR